MIKIHADNGRKSVTVFIGTCDEVRVSDTYTRGAEIHPDGEDVCVFVDQHYSDEEMAVLEANLRNLGLDFKSIIVMCG